MNNNQFNAAAIASAMVPRLQMQGQGCSLPEHNRLISSLCYVTETLNDARVKERDARGQAQLYKAQAELARGDLKEANKNLEIFMERAHRSEALLESAEREKLELTRKLEDADKKLEEVRAKLMAENSSMLVKLLEGEDRQKGMSEKLGKQEEIIANLRGKLEEIDEIRADFEKVKAALEKSTKHEGDLIVKAQELNENLTKVNNDWGLQIQKCVELEAELSTMREIGINHEQIIETQKELVANLQKENSILSESNQKLSQDLQRENAKLKEAIDDLKKRMENEEIGVTGEQQNSNPIINDVFLGAAGGQNELESPASPDYYPTSPFYGDLDSPTYSPQSPEAWPKSPEANGGRNEVVVVIGADSSTSGGSVQTISPPERPPPPKPSRMGKRQISPGSPEAKRAKPIGQNGIILRTKKAPK